MAALAFVACILAAPVWIALSASVTLFSGYAEARVRWLCFSVRLFARVRVLDGKPPHVDLLARDGTVRKRIAPTKRKQRKTKWGRALGDALMLRRAEAAWILGFAESPAATALACGTLESALHGMAGLLLPDTEARVSVIPAFGHNACRINLEGIAYVRLGKLIQCRLAMRGE